MSSYQFVNSLASCYGQQQRGQDSDYYTPQVQPYAAAGCYSGPASPVQPYGGPYSQPAAHLQNGAEHPFAGCAQRLPGGHPSPRTPTPSATAVSSCKYAAPESTAASPQDLSASSTQSPSSPETRGSSPSPGQPAQGAAGAAGGQPSPQPQQQAGSRAAPSQTTPPSGQSAQQQQKPAYPTTPPQIYPWMRKVHVGQSEYRARGRADTGAVTPNRARRKHAAEHAVAPPTQAHAVLADRSSSASGGGPGFVGPLARIAGVVNIRRLHPSRPAVPALGWPVGVVILSAAKPSALPVFPVLRWPPLDGPIKPNDRRPSPVRLAEVSKRSRSAQLGPVLWHF
ncbi:conserved hypothetical protein [Ixodes scapularis]|uniref:Uncharacterized protein n=1 Tax=Ixodes scapularis TaxID=6945 RepID=B7Q9U1_IXOSC|nr:conserved hypothetical protein [Ixodes scapularis]|eukprot:XP_002406405.1 conserved hypothetical protein [Ixodes scapularis]